MAPVTMVIGLVALAGASPASAKGRTPSPAPAPPPPGWMVDRVRIEPLDPAGELTLDGVGTYRGAMEIGRQPAPTARNTGLVSVKGTVGKTTTTKGTTTKGTTTKGSSTKGSATSRTTITTAPASAVATLVPTTVAPTPVGPATGPVVVINDVSLDDYVRGIAEVPSTWPVEALKAQAIAARTYALHELSVGHPLCATDSCQVYAGLAKERGPAGGNWVAAVQATSGQVLLYKGQPILAMYSSSNGGRSVAGSMPYLQAVDDPDDEVASVSRWQATIAFSTLTTVFATPSPVIDVHRTAHDTVNLIWNNSDGTTGDMDVPSDEFGRRLNGTLPAPAGMPRAFPSMRVSAVTDQEAGSITFFGSGFGHGIGMSQYGALGKAQRGMVAADILAAYYGGIHPATLSAKQLPATVRVTLDGGRSAPVTVTSPGRFRVVAPDGHPLAVVASGTWQVIPGSAGVRLVAPPEQAGPPAVLLAGVDTPVTGTPRVRFRLGAGAAVSVAARAVGRPEVALAPVILDAGDQVVTLPSALSDGEWAVTVTADAGGGRTTAAPADVHVGPVPLPLLPQGELPIVRATSASAQGAVGTPSRASDGLTLAMAMTVLAGLTLAGAVARLGRAQMLDVDPPVARLV